MVISEFPMKKLMMTDSNLLRWVIFPVSLYVECDGNSFSILNAVEVPVGFIFRNLV